MAKVLIVEDEQPSAEALAKLLSRQGHDAKLSLNAPQAITIGLGFRPDLLITDVDLRHALTGFDVARKLREVSPDLKVLFVTGMAADIVERDVEELQGAQVMFKPLDIERVLGVVGEAGVTSPP